VVRFAASHPLKEGKGRCAAVEIMLNSPLISDLIFKGEVHEIKEIMKKSRELGMQTFDQSLFDLFEAGKISYEDALRNADSVNDLRLQIKLHSKEAKNRTSRRESSTSTSFDPEEQYGGAHEYEAVVAGERRGSYRDRSARISHPRRTPVRPVPADGFGVASEAEMQKMMWIFWVGMLVFAPFFALIYVKATRKASPVWAGFRFGLYVGVMLSVMHSFGWYAILPIPIALAFCWFLGILVEFIAAGVAAGLVYHE